MFTIIETPTFSRDATSIWNEDERGDFCAWLAANPLAGDVIPGTGGCRKVRWARYGKAWRGSGDLLYQDEEWSNLVVGDLRKKCTRKYPLTLVESY